MKSFPGKLWATVYGHHGAFKALLCQKRVAFISNSKNLVSSNFKLLPSLLGPSWIRRLNQPGWLSASFTLKCVKFRYTHDRSHIHFAGSPAGSHCDLTQWPAHRSGGSASGIEWWPYISLNVLRPSLSLWFITMVCDLRFGLSVVSTWWH